MYSKRENNLYKHIDFIILDILCMTLSLMIGYISRHGMITMDFFHADNPYIILYIMLFMINLTVIVVNRSYDSIINRGYLEEIRHTIQHCLYVDTIMFVCLFCMSTTGEYSRITLAVFIILNVMLTYSIRCVRKYFVRKKMVSNLNVEQMIVIASMKHAVSCVTELSSDCYNNYQIKGVVVVRDNDDDEMWRSICGSGKINGIPIVCEYEELDNYLVNNIVDSVFIRIHLDTLEKGRLINKLINAGITVHYALTKLETNLPNKTVERIGKYTVMTTGMRLVSNREMLLKRVFDIVGGLVGTFITGIFAVIFGPIIYFQSPGPILFRQERIGMNGRSFQIYKFRSMYVDAEEKKPELMEHNQMNGLMFKMDNDPRITPIGRFIRKYSIDEFPQFINVLKGDMSLVGTRPPTRDEYEKYSLHHKGRLGSTPGITGLWQISGRSDITDFEEIVALDTEYISNWRFSNDIRIILKTLQLVIKGSGAK